MIQIKTARELKLMREAGMISARALKLAGEAVEPGVTTAEIDRIARKYIEGMALLHATRDSLYAGIKAAVPGGRLGDIGSAVQRVAEGRGYSVVRDFVGHGVGANLHEDPSVPNYGTPGRGVRLLPGMTLAIEPMINQGKHDVRVLADGWTVLTCDGKLSAHFEHTVAITADGPVILTRPEEEALMILERGRVVLSKAGRDQGRFLAVLSIEGQTVLLADGKERPLERPKRKNSRHVQATNTLLPDSSLSTNREIRKALRSVSDSGGRHT